MAGKSGNSMLAAGATAPSVSLRDLAGNAVSLRQLSQEGPVLLAFFKGSCPVCQYTLPFLDRATDNGNIRIVCVSQDSASETTEFAQAFRLRLPMFTDNRGDGYAASNAFGITHVPSMFQLEPDGSVSHAWTGWSKSEMQSLAGRTGAPVIQPGEQVPAFRPG
ncbi:MAG: TlpA family protein disulfide reductase [Bryobacterales bacterium]|nr:TlpA family protein disulfide reductase [Bryobacterales bacterium]